MSFNRENVVWQSANGTWSMAMYEVFTTGDLSDPYYDAEWDVEYGTGFEWLSQGHATEEAAKKSWTGANPGSHTVVEYSPQTIEDIAELDNSARRFLDSEFALKQDLSKIRAEIRATAQKANLRAGVNVTVGVYPRTPKTHNDTTLTLGLFGTLSRDGDWLVLVDGGKKVKVVQADTLKPHPRVGSLQVKRVERMRARYGW